MQCFTKKFLETLKIKCLFELKTDVYDVILGKCWVELYCRSPMCAEDQEIYSFLN